MPSRSPRTNRTNLIPALAGGGRAVLLLVALLALGTAVLWRCGPGAVDSLDRLLRGRALYRAEASFEAGRTALATRRAEGLAELDQLAGELDARRPGDALFGVRQATLTTLARAHAEDGRAAEALAAAERRAAANAFDLEARVERARLALSTTGRAEQGRAELTALAARFPEARIVSEAWCEALLAAGERGLGAEQWFRFLARGGLVGAPGALPVTTPWRAEWQLEDGARGGAPIEPALDGERLSVSCALPAGARRLWLSAPAGAVLALRQPTLSVRIGGGELRRPLGPDTLLDGATLAGGVLDLAHGADPGLAWALPAGRPDQPIVLELDGIVQQARSPVLADLLAAPETAARAEALAASADPAARATAARHRAVRDRVLGSAKVRVRTAGASDATTELRLSADAHGGFAFAGEVAVPAGTGAVSIELPAVCGLSVGPASGLCRGPDGAVLRVEPDAGVELSGDGFRVTGRPARLGVLAPPSTRLGEHIQIAGWAR